MLRQYWQHWVHQPRFKFCATGQIGGIRVVMAVYALGPKKMLAVFGEVHPKTLAEMDVKGPAVAFTIWPAEIPMPRNASATRPALHLNDLQAVERDFALLLIQCRGTGPSECRGWRG